MKIIKNIALGGMLLVALTSCSNSDQSSNHTSNNTVDSSSQTKTAELSQEEIRANYKSGFLNLTAKLDSTMPSLDADTPEDALKTLRFMANTQREISNLVPPDDLRDLHEEYKSMVLAFANRIDELADHIQSYIDGKLSEEELNQHMENFTLALYLTVGLSQETEDALLTELGLL